MTTEEKVIGLVVSLGILVGVLVRGAVWVLKIVLLLALVALVLHGLR
jgi:hypothetical protein